MRCRVLGMLLRGGLGDGFSLEDFEHCGNGFSSGGYGVLRDQTCSCRIYLIITAVVPDSRVYSIGMCIRSVLICLYT